MHFIKNINRYIGSSEGWLYIMAIFVWSYPLLGLLNAVFLRIPFLKPIAPYSQTFILIASIIFALRAFIRKLSFCDIAFYLSVCLVYAFQYILFPNNTQYLDDSAFSLISVIPYYFLGLIFDNSNLKKALFISSCFTILFRIYHDIFFVDDFIGNLDGGGHESAMWQAYTTLPYILYVCWYMFQKKDLIATIFLFIGLFLLISYGNRGSIVCLISYMVLNLILFTNLKRKWLTILIILSTSFFLVNYFIEIIMALNLLLEELGMSTRLVEKLLESDFLYTDDRDLLINQIKPYMDRMGLMGLGINGTYPIIGIYPHKIHYDLWISFGYFFGTIIMILLLHLYIKCNKILEKDGKQLLLLFCILGIEPLFFSFSFIIWPYFFMYIGFCVGRIRRIKLNSI